MDDATIVRSLLGDATEQEEQDLLQWRKAAPANELRYNELLKLWQLFDGFTADSSAVSAPTGEHLRRIAEAPRRSQTPSRPAALVIRPFTWRRKAIGLAAALLILAIGLGEWTRRELQPLKGRKTGPPVESEYLAGPAGIRTVDLEDGSVVLLAPHSRLLVQPFGDRRQVFLQGRAEFDVAKVPGHPFTVRTDAGEATVLGTRFVIRTRRRDMQLAVFEGKVAVSAVGGAVEIQPGEVGTITDRGAPDIVKIDATRGPTEWLRASLIFRETSLRSAVSQIEDWYGARVAIEDSTLAGRRVTAWFTDQTFDQVVTTVCRVVEANCSVTGVSATVSTVKR